jgi:hypothetical protein
MSASVKSMPAIFHLYGDRRVIRSSVFFSLLPGVYTGP